MESSIQQNTYYQNRLKYADAGPYPIYDLYPIEKKQYNKPQKKKKIKLSFDKKKKIKLSDKIMALDFNDPSLSKDFKPIDQTPQNQTPQESYNSDLPIKLTDLSDETSEENTNQSGGANIKRIFLTTDLIHDDKGNEVELHI
tara:strand:+ start:448 stop:873 length:426 start_codon:yes stop_codon:yes gene_type:complete